MKTKLVVLLLLSLASLTSHAAVSAGTAVQVLFAGQSVGAVSWLPIVASTQKGISGISVYSTAGLPLEVGLASASEAANAEVSQMLVPPALSSIGVNGATFYPLVAGYGTRVSIRAHGSSGVVVNTGEMEMDLFYN